MTAAERLLALSKSTGTAGALLLLIGSGATSGVALLDYSGLESATASAHLLYEQVAFGGANGSRTVKKKSRWVQRNGKILIFESADAAQKFIDSETSVKQKRNKTKQVNNSDVKPVDIIDNIEIKRLAKAYQYREKLYDADQIGDVDRIVQIYKELQRREEEDIEFILMVA